MSDPALPSSLSFQGKSPSVRARSYRAMSQPSNGHAHLCGTGGTLIRIPIPCGKNGTYLDPHSSYLSYNIANTGADAVLSNGAWCVIQELKVVSQGVTLSHINQYNVLHSALMSLQCGSDIETSHNLLSGTNAATSGVTIATNANKTFCFSLLDGILGSLAEKMVPLGALSDLEIQITLASDAAAVNAAGATVLTISEVKWFSSMVEIDQSAQKVLEMSLAGGIYRLDSKGYHNYNDTIPSGVSNASVQVAAKFQSLNAVLVMMRDSTRATAQNKHSISARERRGLASFQVEIAGQLYPPQPVTCADANISHCASELYKCYRALHPVYRRF